MTQGSCSGGRVKCTWGGPSACDWCRWDRLSTGAPSSLRAAHAGATSRGRKPDRSARGPGDTSCFPPAAPCRRGSSTWSSGHTVKESIFKNQLTVGLCVNKCYFLKRVHGSTTCNMVGKHKHRSFSKNKGSEASTRKNRETQNRVV